MRKHLVLIGGGHTHALVLHALAQKPVRDARVTLINPGPRAPYSGMLPGFVAGHYTRSEFEIDLAPLARAAGAELIVARATSLDPTARQIALDGQAGGLAYDLVSVDIGITSDLPALKGYAAHALPAKPLDALAARWQDYLAGTGPAAIAVIGGGVAGAELAMAMAFALRAKARSGSIHLIDRGTVLKGFRPATRARLLAALAEWGVQITEQAEVAEITPDAVHLADGRALSATLTIAAAGARPQAWLAETGLAHEAGFLRVGPSLQTSDPAVYAVGDCAHLTHAPRPKAGVFAVRAAPVLTHNLRAAIDGSPLREFHPQSDYLKLIALGEKRAVAEKWGLALESRVFWWLKDRIDQKFMAQFRALG